MNFKNWNVPISSLAFHSLGFLLLGVQYAELKLRPHFRLVAGDQEEIQGQVVLGVFIQPFRIYPQAPLHLVILCRESGGLQHFAKILSCVREVRNSPHVRKLHHFHLRNVLE